MGKQINFYLTNADQVWLENSLVEKFGLLLIDRHLNVNEQWSVADHNSPIAILTAPSMLTSVKFFAFQHPSGRLTVDTTNSPVIELLRCSEKDRQVNRGRLWFSTSLGDLPADLRDEFYALGRASINWARRNMRLVKSLDAYTTDQCMEAFNSGRLAPQSLP
jgi:hypothetical protein